MSQSYGIHWFRRDLRVAGNRALQKNWKANNGRVVGLFCFDKKFLSRPDFSVNRFQFFIKALFELQKELRDLGSDLLFLDEGPQAMLPPLLEELKQSQGVYPSLVTWSRDYEPFARKRDAEMKDLFKQMEISTGTCRDHLLIEPHELSKKGTTDEHYQIYSPFARMWLQILQEDEIQKRLRQQKAGLDYLARREHGELEKIFSLTWSELLRDAAKYESNLKHYIESNGRKTTVEIPEAGSMVAYKTLKDFASRLDDYADKRDFPDLNATSRFSLFLKNGTLTVPQIVAYFNFDPYKKKKTGRDSFFSELIWREFYYHILYHNPNVEHEAFLETYRDMKWENNPQWFEKWKNGMTGFPIVDAGMRELKETGWMHNRVRMIVASFLTKDLLIDWRWGEKYFMDQLLDGDLAPNNGGWQWAASTGCDPQPYFRIFNPWSQSKKFDPEAKYIKRYIPELNDVPISEIHQPIIGHRVYPEPMVDHAEQREKALDLYKITRA